MPSFAKVDEFIARARKANPHFERYKTSALHGLIEILKSEKCTKLQVLSAVLTIPQAKWRKYQDAFIYLFTKLPGLDPAMLYFGALGKANAAKFPKTEIPKDYAPKIEKPQIVVGTPPVSFLEKSCEQFLMDSNERNGIILIHLCAFQKPMNDQYNGKPVVDHMNTVLRVAKLLDIPVCSLHMKENTPVCHELKEAYDAVPRRYPVFRKQGHMGSVDREFREFAESMDNCIVMGFDGTICVPANIFGCPEYVDAQRTCPAPPLITLTNVITSRAVLVCDGGLYSKAPGMPYGVLTNT